VASKGWPECGRRVYRLTGAEAASFDLNLSVAIVQPDPDLENLMASEKGPNIKKKAKCKNCEGKGLLKKGDRVVKCQRCKGTGVR
jgi:hypothetical protein